MACLGSTGLSFFRRLVQAHSHGTGRAEHAGSPALVWEPADRHQWHPLPQSKGMETKSHSLDGKSS